MTGYLRFACLLIFVLLFGQNRTVAQVTFPVNGVYDQRQGLYAFTNATIYTAYNTRLDNATLLIREGKVVSVGLKVVIPADAVVIDLKGKTIYPSFIDLYSDYGMPAQRQDAAPGGRAAGMMPQRVSSKKGPYGWNESLKSEFRAHEVFTADEKTAKPLRDLGFGAVLTHQHDGVSRGSSSLVVLGEESENLLVVKDRAAHHLSFRKGTSRQDYPNSLMGTIALLRQTYYDAQWYAKTKEEFNLSLQAWNELMALPQVFEVADRAEALRAAALGKEFGVKYIIKGAGDEYQRSGRSQKNGFGTHPAAQFPRSLRCGRPARCPPDQPFPTQALGTGPRQRGPRSCGRHSFYAHFARLAQQN
jgi:hypothetical protein